FLPTSADGDPGVSLQPLFRSLLHEHEARGLLLGQLEDGDAGRRGQHLGDDSLVDDSGGAGLAALPLLLEAQALTEQLLLLVTQRARKSTRLHSSHVEISYAVF